MAEDGDLVAHALILGAVLVGVVGGVLDDHLDLATGDPATLVDEVPVDLLGSDDVLDQRSERTAQVGQETHGDRVLGDTDVEGDIAFGLGRGRLAGGGRRLGRGRSGGSRPAVVVVSPPLSPQATSTNASASTSASDRFICLIRPPRCFRFVCASSLALTSSTETQ